MSVTYENIVKILGKKDAKYLLDFESPKIAKENLTHPGFRHIEHVFSLSDRNKKTIENLKRLYSAGRLGGTGYISILPVDQGIEHSAGARFATNPQYFDPQWIVKLAVEGGCSAVASTLGVLGMMSRKYAQKIPFILKLNHNDLFRYPNDHDQRMFADVHQAIDMGAAGVGATVYFGSPESKRQMEEVGEAFEEAHRAGLFTVLWCYVRNSAFVVGSKDYNESADLTGQANYLGVTLGADIIKQKLPSLNGGYKALNKGRVSFGKYDERMYSELSSDHPIDMCRYQVLNCFSGRIGMISSGGESHGADDLRLAVREAVINKRAGGHGLVMGRKAFERPFEEGVKILRAVQDVYLCHDVTMA
jgi:class I fructose-bisphosphate aldolase